MYKLLYMLSIIAFIKKNGIGKKKTVSAGHTYKKIGKKALDKKIAICMSISS